METDEDIMKQALDQIEKYIKEKQFEKALPAINDSLNLENWKNTYGTQLILAQAYC